MKRLSFLKMTPALAVAAMLAMLTLPGVWIQSTAYADAISPQDTCSGQMPGDVNGDGAITAQDLTDLQQILSLCSALAPTPAANGDPNGDCLIDWRDASYLAQYLFHSGPAPVTCTCLEPSLNKTWLQSGDANGDAAIDISDCVFLIQYIFGGGPAPQDVFSGDNNCDCLVDVSDAVRLILCIFTGEGCSCTCDDWLSHCGAE